MNPYVNVFPDFEKWMRGNPLNLAPSTARKYKQYVTKFCKYHDPVTFTKFDSWYDSIHIVVHDGVTKPASASTVNYKLASMRAFYAFLIDKGWMTSDPTEGLPMKTPPKRLPKPVEKEDLTALYEAIDASDWLGVQDLAIVETLYGSGLRRNEAAILRFHNIVNRDVLKVVGKGNKERIVPITRGQWEALADWCILHFGDNKTQYLVNAIDKDAAFTELRKRDSLQDEGLFVTEEGDPIVSLKDPGHFIYQRIAVLREKANVDVTPHRLRHSFATHLLEAGADLAAIQDAMGHASPETTRIYTEVAATGIRRLGASHPRSNRKENDDTALERRTA